MGFNNRFLFLKWILIASLALFAVIVLPLAIYHQFVLKAQNRAWNVNHCETELIKASNQVRTYLTDQVDAAKKLLDTGSAPQNSLSMMVYELHKDKWNIKNVLVHSDLSRLYKIKVDDIVKAYQSHELLNPVSQEIKLERRTIKDHEVLGIYFIHRNPEPKLIFIHFLPENLQKSLKTDSTCSFALVDNAGNTVTGFIPDNVIKSFLLEYQSYNQNSTKLVQSLQASVDQESLSFLYNSVLKNVLLVSTVSPKINPMLAQYLDLFGYNSILILLFIISMCFLILQFVTGKMFVLKDTLEELSHGIYKSHPRPSEDPIFSEIFKELAKFSNHFLFRMRTISKFQKLQNLKDAELKHEFQHEETVVKKVMLMHLELKNQESVTYDYKIMQDVAELSSLWANLGEMVEDSGGIIDTLTGGTIRAMWFMRTFEPRNIDVAVKLALEIQDLVNSINKHRFINNSSPYKIHIGLHRGEVIMTSLGPLERKEFTPLGADLEKVIAICGVAKETLSPIVLSHSVFEFVNKNYFFSVLSEVVGDEKLYNIHTHSENPQKNKKGSVG